MARISYRTHGTYPGLISLLLLRLCTHLHQKTNYPLRHRHKSEQREWAENANSHRQLLYSLEGGKSLAVTFHKRLFPLKPRIWQHTVGHTTSGARDSVHGSGDIFNPPYPSSHIMRGKARPARLADSLTTIYDPNI
jgi:hypothetical protein